MRSFQTLIITTTLFCLSACASTNEKPRHLVTASYAGSSKAPVLLAPTLGVSCTEIGRKRIVKVAYLWPVNRLREEDLRKTEKTARRYRTEITAGDIGWSVLGFLVGVITETTVVEACDSPYRAVDDAGTARLKTAERKIKATEPERVTVFFRYASARLLSGENERLTAIAARLKEENSGTKILIIGHADRAGTVAFNHRLSGERARTVRRQLMRAGIDARRLFPVAAGERWPVSETARPDRRKARRVEIIAVQEGK